MAHGDPREGKERGNWRMEWVASTLHTTSEHGVSSLTTADAHTSAASSRLNWRPPADLNGLVRFAERRNPVCALVPSHFKLSLPTIWHGALTGCRFTNILFFCCRAGAGWGRRSPQISCGVLGYFSGDREELFVWWAVTLRFPVTRCTASHSGSLVVFTITLVENTVVDLECNPKP